ncbi:MAG: di-heme-cytochrome C peroxidase [Dokdonella sp.]|uniref:di-heme-cytochrome C peroxidase n=1 Tax=Dokdonella sp. TaxID=2291710 RepID=UPI00326308F5
MKAWIIPAAIVVAVALGSCRSPEKPIANDAAVRDGDGAINLAQGWSREVQERAWFSSFGSRLVPTAWLRVLEQSGNTQRFATDDHMDALGFLTQSAGALNPDGFPVGFTQETDAQGTDWTGLGCAACHTGEVRYGGHRIRLDGGQGTLDFVGFEGALIDSLDATVADDAKFERFATALGVNDERRTALKGDVAALAARIAQRHRMNHVDVPYGYGRLDAFGQIFNAIAVQFLGIPDNRRAPDAPVSFPVLWDAPHLDLVQWNGSAPNAGPGPLLQNITTALAVYGSLDVSGHDGLAGFPSSIDFSHLAQIQDDLYALQSPQWPANLFGALDPTRVSHGAQIYAQQCIRCHRLSDRNDPKRELKSEITPLAEVGTDPRMVNNVLASVSSSGSFEGHKLGVVLGDPIGPRAQTSDLVVHAAVGAALRHPLAAVRDAVAGYHEVIKAAIASHPDGYKARPLSGIWASAPYLHNGSVPSLAELLKPPPDRVRTFPVGSRAFDPATVGLAADDAHPPETFDTALPGNANSGHVYGTALADADKRDLLEYLKSL